MSNTLPTALSAARTPVAKPAKADTEEKTEPTDAEEAAELDAKARLLAREAQLRAWPLEDIEKR